MTSWRFNTDRRLYLPITANERTRLARTSGYMHIVLGWAQLYPDSPPTTFERIKSLAGQLSCEGALYLVSLVQLVMGPRRALTTLEYVRQQRDIATALFPDVIAQRIHYHLDAGTGDTIMHSEQLLIAAMLAVHYGRPGPRTSWDAAVGAEFVLRLLDLLDVSAGSDRDDLLRLVLRRLGATPGDQERYVLGRYFDLLVKRPRERWGSVSPFDRVFMAAKSYSMEQYLGVGMVLIHRLLDPMTVAELTRIRFDRVIPDQVAALPSAGPIADELVANLDWFRSHPRTTPHAADLALANLEAFFDKPLIRVESEAVLPMSMPIVLQRLATGMYWTLFTYKQATEHGIEDMNSSLGQVFQEYCTDALRGACPPASRFVPESSIAGPSTVSKPDLILAEGTKWIVIETTVSTVPKGTLLSGDVAAFRRQIAPQSQLGKKFRQPLAATVNLMSGEISHGDLDPAKVTEIFPVVLFLHPFPQHALTQDEVASTYEPPKRVDDGHGGQIRVHDLQFLSAEEMEVLEPMLASGILLSDLLSAKEAADPFLRGGPMKNFLFSRPGWFETDNPRMRALLDILRDTCGPAVDRLVANGT